MDYRDPYAKTSSREENGRIEFAVSCMKGTRNEMQDYHTAILELDGSNSTLFFGVFDGHGGDKVALDCSKRFHIELVKDPHYANDPHTAMENVCFRMHEQVQGKNESRKSPPANSNTPYKEPQKEGNTACVALIRGNQIIVGNVGDSRCVLSRGGQAIDLSTDHKPDDPDERQGIEAAGGKVVHDRVPKIVEVTGAFLGTEPSIYRVDGERAISRAMGDLKYKQTEGLIHTEQKMAFNPTIHTENITGDTKFLLIASDNIWHGVKSQDVVDFVSKHLKSGKADLSGICDRVNDCFNASADESTVILVKLKDGALVSSKTAEIEGTNIPDDLLQEILVRLPSTLILRCRFGCKKWCKITNTPKFLEEHHRQQKLQVIVPVHYSGNIYSCLHRVFAIKLHCPEDEIRTRTIIKSTTFGKYKVCDDEGEDKGIVSVVHASLDGLLLLSFDKSCFIANPATRKPSHLLPLYNAEMVLGLYKHPSSGEYRVLYKRASEGVDSDEEDLESFCILSLGSQVTRSIPMESKLYAKLVFAMDGQVPAVIGDRLYWPPSTFQTQITVFDSESEVFQWMEPPAEASSNSIIKFLQLTGTLAVSVSTKGASKVELYLLDDSQSETWARSRTIEFPVTEIDTLWAKRFEAFFVSLNGDILIECVWRDDGDRKEKSPGKLLHYDHNGKLEVLCEDYWGTSPIHVLKENLISHTFLIDSAQKSPLFKDL